MFRKSLPQTSILRHTGLLVMEASFISVMISYTGLLFAKYILIHIECNNTVIIIHNHRGENQDFENLINLFTNSY